MGKSNKAQGWMEESNWGGSYLCWIVEAQKKEKEEEEDEEKQLLWRPEWRRQYSFRS